MIVVNNEPERKIRQVEIRVGDEWIQHDFGREVSEEAARWRVLQMVDALLPAPLRLRGDTLAAIAEGEKIGK